MPTCIQCKSSFQFTDLDRQFLDKLGLPEPQSCPRCRRKQRLAFWPFGVLQKRKCDFSGETIISTFPEGSRFPVYKRDYWFTDKWDAPEQEIDWNKSILDQLYELQSKTPHFHRLGKNSENSDYADDVWDSRNIYLSRSMADCEDLCYVYRVVESKDSIDLTYCFGMEQSYECTYCFSCYNLKFALDCRNCSDSYFLYDCRSCQNCFMCWNLRNKEYHILNKPYTKKEYFSKLAEFNLNSRKSLEELGNKFKEHLKNDALHKVDFNVQCESSQGNYMTECKDCEDCYFLERSRDSLYVMRGIENKDCIDTSGLLRGEFCSNICQSTNLNSVHSALYSFDCLDSYYIDQCFNGKNLFACVGLKRKEHCILNKQYSKEEYEELVPKLIEKMEADGEWGQPLPYKMAYNGFNLSLGAFYYAETKESIEALGGFWEEPPRSKKLGINAKELPALAEEVSDDLVGQALKCAATGQPFRFIKKELDFYRHHNLPYPIYYPEERNRRRFTQLVPLNLKSAGCYACGKEITHYYPESWGYKKVLCEECYLKKVY